MPMIIKIIDTNSTATNIASRVIIARIYSFPGFKAVDNIRFKLLTLIYLRSKSLPRKRPTIKAIKRLSKGFSLI